MRVGATLGCADARGVAAPHLWDVLDGADRARLDALALTAAARWVEACATIDPLRVAGPDAGDWVSTAFVNVETLEALGLLYALRRVCDRGAVDRLQLYGAADPLLLQAAAAVGRERQVTVEVCQQRLPLRAQLRAWPPAYWAGDIVQRWLLPRWRQPRQTVATATDRPHLLFAGFAPNHFRILRPVMQAAVERGYQVTLAAMLIQGAAVHAAAAAVPGIEHVQVDGLVTRHDLVAMHALRRQVQRLWKRGTVDRALTAAFAPIDPHLWNTVREHAAGWLLVHLPIGARFLAVWRRLLARLSPAAVVLGNDGCHRGRTLVAAARERGVPSIVVQHGVIAQRALYVPRADYMAAWGPATVRALAPLRVAPDRFLVTGAPLRRSAGRTPPRPGGAPLRRVLLATNALRPFLADTQGYVRRVLDAVAPLPDVQLTVCPHPTGENADAYRRLVAPLGARATVRPGETATALHEADVVLVLNSTVALDALAMGTPVIALVGTELADSTGFAESPLIAYAGDSAALSRLLCDPAELYRRQHAQPGACAALVAEYLGAADRDPAQVLLDRLPLAAPQTRASAAS